MREQIDLLEDKIQELGKKEQILIAITIPIVTLLLFYYFYISDALENQQKNDIQIEKITHKLKKHSQKILLRKIEVSKKEMLTLKSQIATDTQKLNYLNAKLSEKDFLFLSQKNFTHFLNNLLEKSLKNNFLVNNITISEENKKYIEKINYKKLVQITGSGEFLNTLRFIRAVEDSTMLFQIKNLIIETNGTMPHTAFDINFYGVEK